SKSNPWMSGLSSLLENVENDTNRSLRPSGRTPIESLAAQLSRPAKKLLVQASASPDGFVSKHNTDSYGEVVNIHTQDQSFLGKPEDSRNRALWVHAFNELVNIGC